MKKYLPILIGISIGVGAANAEYSRLCSPFKSISDFGGGMYTDSVTSAPFGYTTATDEQRIYGILMGHCSTAAGSVAFEASDNPAVSGTANGTKYCWCQITEPVLSNYIYTYQFSSTYQCLNSCTEVCVQKAAESNSFITALFDAVISW